jgi:CRISPR/Cas system-associated protein endoribonuclease Cas2
MSKSVRKLTVNNNEITVIKEADFDVISLTDMLKAKDGDFFITDWLRNRNTLDFLAVWEQLHNPDFNYGEFAIIRNESGTNLFKISVKEWKERTNAIGLKAKTGRYGGTFAHQDIAFEFGTWISPIFRLYLIKEFQRLKEQESKLLNNEWDYRRFLSKVNYRIHTDAIKESIIPKYKNLNKDDERYVYANEAEMLNVAVFGITSKQWKQDNPEMVLKGLNIRDIANIPQLTVLANIESYNAALLKEGLPGKDRLTKLKNEAVSQLKSLSNYKYSFPIESPQLLKFEQEPSRNKYLKVIPPKK